jgi:hypothetical protein
MRILFTVHLDGDFRTGDGAQRTTCACFTAQINDGAVALGIILRGRLDMPVFTGIDAKVAFLAAFEIDDDAAFFQWGFRSFKKFRQAFKPARPFLRKT